MIFTTPGHEWSNPGPSASRLRDNIFDEPSPGDGTGRTQAAGVGPPRTAPGGIHPRSDSSGRPVTATPPLDAHLTGAKNERALTTLSAYRAVCARARRPTGPRGDPNPEVHIHALAQSHPVARRGRGAGGRTHRGRARGPRSAGRAARRPAHRPGQPVHRQPERRQHLPGRGRPVRHGAALPRHRPHHRLRLRRRPHPRLQLGAHLRRRLRSRR